MADSPAVSPDRATWPNLPRGELALGVWSLFGVWVLVFGVSSGVFGVECRVPFQFVN